MPDDRSIRTFLKSRNAKTLAKQKRKPTPSKTLVLIPRCLQNSDCLQKVVENVENCKRCGNCSIANLMKMKDAYGYQMFVATGGTLARKIVKDTKPELILAVACERELFSGVKEVKRIPVIAIPNQRPNGPCKDTEVDVKALEKIFILLDAQ